MKKFLLCIFSFLFIGTALAGSSFLLAGCDSSYSQEENENNESDLGNNEENTDTPSEDNDETGNNEENQSGSGEESEDGQVGSGNDAGLGNNGGNNDETEQQSTDHDFYIISQLRSSSTSYSNATQSINEAYETFQVTWKTSSTNTVDWGSAPTVNTSGTTTSGAGTVYATYFHYDYWTLFNYARYAYIKPTPFPGESDSEYVYCGISLSSSWSNSSYTTAMSSSYYYNGSSLSTSSSISTSASVKGTVYIKYRRIYDLTFYHWSSPGKYTEYNEDDLYAGVSTKIIRDASDDSPNGYTFLGWSTSQNASTPTYKVNDSISASAANKAYSLYAVYAPKITIYSYYTSDYNSISGPSSTGGTIKISYTNPLTGSSTSASSIANSSYDVGYNKSVTLTATAKSGYSFRGWYTARPTSSATPVSTSSSYSFTPTTGAPYERYALFVRTQIVNIHNQYTTTYTSFTDGSTGGTTSVTYTNNANKSTTSTVSTSLDINALYNKTVKLTATAKSGYKFMGWYSAEPTSNESSFRLSTSTSYSFTSNTNQTKIYALFAKQYTFTVNFTDYGYTNSTNIRFVQDDIGMDVTVSPGKSYSFTTYCRPTSQRIEFTTTGSGDYYIGNGSVDEDSSVNSYAGYWTTIVDVELDITVRQRYTITYNKNNGSGTLSPTSQYKMYGKNVTLGTNNLTRTGYAPNGWNTNASGTGTHYNNGASYSGNGNVTLYAQWTANTYVVNFDTANEILYPYGKNQSSTQGTYTTKVENNVLIYEYKVTSVGINGPHASGVDLTIGQQYKWSIDVKCSRAITIRSMGHEMGGVKSNVAVTTSWQTITYTFTATENANGYHAFIFYNNNNTWQVGDVFSYKNLSIQKVSGMKADNAIGNLTVTYDGTYASLPTPTRAGYTFAGWYLDSGLTKPVTTSTKVTTASNHTLYSKWTQKQFLVDINVLNPSGEQDYVSGTFDVYYSYTGVTHNDLTDQFTPSTVVYGGTIVISDIKPANGYAVESVYLSTSSGKGTLTSSNGKYTFTANADGQHQVNWYNGINIKMKYATYTMTYNANGGSVKNYNYATRVANVSGNYGGVTLNYNATTQIATLTGTMTESSEITRYYASNFVAGTYTIGYEVVGGSMSRTDGCFVFEFLNSSGSALSTRTYYNYWDDTSTFSATLTLSASMAKETQQFAVWLYRTNNGGYQFNDLQIKVWCYLETPAVTTQKVTYTKATVMPYAVKDGFRFIGWNTKSDGTGVLVGPGNVATLTANTTLYAIYEAINPAKYDATGGYYYVEIGNMPQTKVTDSNLISQLNSSTTNGATYYINGTTMVSKKVNNVEYCKYGNNWYKVEPIRWRLAYSSSQKSGYGTTTDTFAVLDTIVYAGQYASGRLGGGQGYVTTTLDEFKKNITSTTYLANFSANVESYGTQVVITSKTANMFISSADEISSVLNNKSGSAKYSVKFSDLVSDILGNGINQYYTRNLGSNISNIKSYTELGMATQNLCTNIQGVQFTIKVSEYGCV